jgi:hypothetical protein
MDRKIGEMSAEQIDNQIANYERLKKTNLARYKELVEARGQRSGLKFEKSRALIEAAAARGKFVTYGDLAQASGVQFDKVRFAMNAHLWDLVKWSHHLGLPMLSAIVVNQNNRESGEMEPETIRGFVRAAEGLGYIVGEPREFLSQQQRELFARYGGSSSPP